MKVYLAKFYLNNKVAYKIGHTKYFKSIKRFQKEVNGEWVFDKQYKVFDKISILDDILVQHSDAVIARNTAKVVEECLHAIFPKNFRLESHFLVEDNAFNGLSGITEMFILENNQTEESVKNTFNNIKLRIEALL